MKTKFIFLTGGVVSSLGKGTIAASIGQILKSRGLKVFMQKFDPYLNVNPGALSPLQHGEVFVTSDGAETDLDLGHYERFIDEDLSKYSSISAGKIYQNVFENESRGLYRGKTIQVIPHVTDEIKKQLKKVALDSKADVIITEIGGTIGDIESLPFIEAIRQARRDFGYNNTLYIHATLVPYIAAAREYKSKPTQHSVKMLESYGIHPDIIVLRSDKRLNKQLKEKISLFCDVKPEAVFDSYDVPYIYQAILNLKKQAIDDYILRHFKITGLKEADLSAWERLITKIKNSKKHVKIALVGKYVSLHDAYLSVVESLKHASYFHEVKLDLVWIRTNNLTRSNAPELLAGVDGIVAPGGFGKDGIWGLTAALEYGRVNKIPTFGICFGMEFMAIEFARNVLGYKDATSEECEVKSKNLVIIDNQKLHPDLEKNSRIIGLKKIDLLEGSKVSDIYNTLKIEERHRHNYSFNNKYLDEFNENGFKISGYETNYHIPVVFELEDHPFYLGVQYHPEFISRPLKPHPLFIRFLKEALSYQSQK